MRLKVIIEHVGASVHSGHYLTHVRQDDGTYLTCDDERVRTTNQLLENTFRNSRLYIYEATTQSRSDVKLGGASSGANDAAPVEKGEDLGRATERIALQLALDESKTESKTEVEHPFMTVDQGQDKVKKDAKALLDIFGSHIRA